MSAFVCNSKTVGTIARRLVEYFDAFEVDDKPMTPANFAEEMAMVNLQSVGYRYQMTVDETIKDFMEQDLTEYVQECRKVADSIEVVEVDEGHLWGAVSCWLYQSCESDMTMNSQVYKTVQEFEDVLEHRCRKAKIQREGWGL